MTKVKVPFIVDDQYAMITLECGGLPPEELTTSLRKHIDFDMLEMDLERRIEIHED